MATIAIIITRAAMLSPAQRRQFDVILDAIIAELPEHYHELLEEIPVVVEDRPSSELLEELEIDANVSDLCGLHSGVPLTRRSVDHSGVLPDQIMLFREPIMRLAAAPMRVTRRFGAARENAKRSAREALEFEIRVTLLHEMGHHFGLDEDELSALGYG